MAYSDFTTNAQLAAIYVGYFGRAADPDGLAYWNSDYTGIYDANRTAGQSEEEAELNALIEIATSFSDNTETMDMYTFLADPATGDAGAFVDAVYDNLFGRAPDTAGKDYWVTELEANIDDELYVGKFILSVMNAAGTDTVDPDLSQLDLDTMTNRAEVSAYYAAQVEGEGAEWTSEDDIADAQSVIAGVTDDDATVDTARTEADALIAADLPSTFTLTADTTSVLEGAIATFTVTASQAVTEDTDVTFNVIPGDTTAADQGTSDTNMNDFSAGTFNPSVITIAAGETTATYTVMAANDGLTELPENYSVTAAISGQDDMSVSMSLLDGAGTFTLTTGVDSGAAFTGGIADDTFTAGDTTLGATWTTGDQLDGGGGMDTFTVIQNAALTNNPTAATVVNIETANITSGGTIGATSALNTTTWTGLTTLNTTSLGGASVTAAATTDANVTDTILGNGAIVVNGGKDVTATADKMTTGTITVGAGTAAAATSNAVSTGVYVDNADNTLGAIAITGGTAITSTQTSGVTTAQETSAKTDTTNNTITLSAVTATGDSATTSVTVNQSKAVAEVDYNAGPPANVGKVGVTNGAVTVNDANRASTSDAGTITTVTLGSYGASTVNSGALTTLNLSGTGGILGVTAGALGTAVVDTMALNVDGLTAGNITLDADYKTLNVVGSNNASVIADITSTGATAVNVSGDAKVTFTDQSLTNANLSAITVTNTGGGVFGTTAIGTSTLFTGGTGDDGVVLASTTKAITMGDGNDSVTTTTGVVGTNGSVDAGDGTDTIVMTGVLAAVADNDATFNSKFTNFETLSLSAIAGETIALAGINGVSNVTVAASGSTVTLNNFKTGGTLNLLGTNTSVTVGIDNANFNPADELNVTLTNSTGAIDAFGTVVAAGVETVNFTTNATHLTTTGAVVDTATLTGTSAKTITVTGNNGLNLTTTGNVAVTSFDASGVVADGTNDTAAGLGVTYASASTVTDKTITITGGDGEDTLTGYIGQDTISGGKGADTISGGKGVDILTGGDKVDTFAFSTVAVAADTFVLVDTIDNKDTETIVVTTGDTDGSVDSDETVTIAYSIGGVAQADITTAASAGVATTDYATVINAALNANANLTTSLLGSTVTVNATGSEAAVSITGITFNGTNTGGAATFADSATGDVAEVDTVTLSSISIGDVLSVTVGANTYTQTAITANTNTELTALVATINAGETILTAAVATATTMTLTGTAAQVELGGFTASASITDTGSGLDAGLLSTTGAGADTITDFNTGGTDILRADAANNVAGEATDAPIGTVKVQISTGGKLTFAAEDDTLQEKLVAVRADDTNVANNEVVFFEDSGNTYVYSAGVDTTSTTSDSLIKLTGVTGLTTMTESGVTPGDFTFA